MFTDDNQTVNVCSVLQQCRAQQETTPSERSLVISKTSLTTPISSPLYVVSDFYYLEGVSFKLQGLCNETAWLYLCLLFKGHKSDIPDKYRDGEHLCKFWRIASLLMLLYSWLHNYCHPW